VQAKAHFFRIANDAAGEPTLNLARRLCLADAERSVDPQQHAEILRNLRGRMFRIPMDD
jgi:hypothetical protein